METSWLEAFNDYIPVFVPLVGLIGSIFWNLITSLVSDQFEMQNGRALYSRLHVAPSIAQMSFILLASLIISFFQTTITDTSLESERLFAVKDSAILGVHLLVWHFMGITAILFLHLITRTRNEFTYTTDSNRRLAYFDNLKNPSLWLNLVLANGISVLMLYSCFVLFFKSY